jgi:UDP-glucose 4-epimerase
MKILVTGGYGFIGSALVKLLSNQGNDVTILTSSKKNDNDIVHDFRYNLKNDFLKNIEVVYHLAGLAHDMRDASKIADLYYKVNVDATVQLANLAVQSGVKRFIFVSSVKAGGTPPLGVCANEKDQKDTKDVYGKTKREAELSLLKISDKSSMHVSIVRPSLVYGPNVRGNLKLMLSGIERGWFPPLPETGNRRSMIHVDDLVRAILLIVEDKRANGKIFIATDGISYSSREIYNSMCNVVGKSIPKWSVPKTLFDLASLISPRIKYKINKLLGDECYSSAKLEGLGFRAKKSLKNMNETDF